MRPPPPPQSWLEDSKIRALPMGERGPLRATGDANWDGALSQVRATDGSHFVLCDVQRIISHEAPAKLAGDGASVQRKCLVSHHFTTITPTASAVPRRARLPAHGRRLEPRPSPGVAAFVRSAPRIPGPR